MEKNRKCVMVMDASLAPGIAANTAALLGMTLGSKVKEAIGCDVQDADGNIPSPNTASDSEDGNRKASGVASAAV